MNQRLVVLVSVIIAVQSMTRADQSSTAEALRNPAARTETAPAKFTASFDTSAGPFVIAVNRNWAPYGADRFYNLVKHGFYDEARFFRVITGFMVQFGIHGRPEISAVWQGERIPTDTVKESNRRGFVAFAMGVSTDTRTTQVFINFRNNSRLDAMGFAPFGQVTSGMDVVDQIFAGYGDGAPRGTGPDQWRLLTEGNPYLLKHFPKLDYIRTARIDEPTAGEALAGGGARSGWPAR